MKVARIFGIALALLVTAMVCQSRADVVEYYLMPIVSGSTPYTTSFSADGSDNITVNSVTTTATAGTIYFDVYAGLTQNNTFAHRRRHQRLLYEHPVQGEHRDRPLVAVAMT